MTASLTAEGCQLTAPLLTDENPQLIPSVIVKLLALGVLLVSFLLVHVPMALDAGSFGHLAPAWALWIRVPLQGVLIAWVLWASSSRTPAPLISGRGSA